MLEVYLQKGIKFVELFALLCGVWIYLRKGGNANGWMVLILSVIVFTDWGGYLIKNLESHGKSIQLWFNILVPLQMVLWCYFFYRMLGEGIWKKAVLYLGIIYILYVAQQLIVDGFGVFHTHTYTAGVILLSVICLRFIYELVGSDAVLALWNEAWLYVAFALLFFYLGTLPFHNMRNYLFNHFPQIFDIYYMVFILLNYLLYFTLSGVLLWKKGK